MRNEIKFYREYDAINYSSLKALSDNPKSVGVLKSSKALTDGSIFDSLVLTPDEFEYAVYDGKAPTSPQLLELLQKCIDEQAYSEYEIEEIANRKANKKYILFGQYTKLESRKKIWCNNIFMDYLHFMKDNPMVISNDKYQEMLNHKEIFINHPFTKNIFENGEAQFAIYNTINGIKYKGLIDYFKQKTEPLDLKTTSFSCLNFEYSKLKYRYDIQSSLYTHLLRESFENVKPMKMVVYSFSEKQPLIYDMTPYIESGRKGFFRNETYYRGWEELANDYMWHKENQLWDYPKKVYDNNGVV